MTTQTDTELSYTSRHFQFGQIKDLDSGVLFTDGWGFGATDDQRAQLKVYGEYLVEHGRGNAITGMPRSARTPPGSSSTSGCGASPTRTSTASTPSSSPR